MKRLLPLLLLSLAACDDDGMSVSGPPDLGPWGAAYAVATTQMANTPAATTLIVAVPSLADGVTVDYGTAINVPDTVSLFGEPGAGHFFATTAQTANVTRYDVDDHGVVTPGQVLSFAQLGLSATYSTRSIVFVSPTKAYLLDDTTLQAISWNPTDMSLGSAISLSMLGTTGLRTNFAYNILRRGNQVVIPAFHYDTGYARLERSTDLALLDVTDDSVKVVHDDRCGGFSTAALAENGDVYFGQDTYAVALHRRGGAAAAAPGCLLRMKAGEDFFDAGFYLEVKDVTGGQLGGAAIAGPGSSIWVRAFDESLFPVTDIVSGAAILAAPAWRWWQLDTASPTAPAKASTLPPGAGEVKWFAVDGHAYAGDANQDYTMTAVVDLSVVAPARGVVLRGHPSGIVKAR